MAIVSQKKFQRAKVVENAVAGRLSDGEAARLPQLSERQVQRLERRYRPDSVLGCITAITDGLCPGLCRRLCAEPSWNWPAASIRASMILISSKNFHSRENLVVSRETVRRTCVAPSCLPRRSVALAGTAPAACAVPAPA